MEVCFFFYAPVVATVPTQRFVCIFFFFLRGTCRVCLLCYLASLTLLSTDCVFPKLDKIYPGPDYAQRDPTQRHLRPLHPLGPPS